MVSLDLLALVENQTSTAAGPGNWLTMPGVLTKPRAISYFEIALGGGTGEPGVMELCPCRAELIDSLNGFASHNCKHDDQELHWDLAQRTVGGHISLREVTGQQEVEMKQLLFHNRSYNRHIVMVEVEHYSVVFYSSFYTGLDRHVRRIHRMDCLRHLDH